MGGISNKPNQCNGKLAAELITHPLMGMQIIKTYINNWPASTIFLCDFVIEDEGLGAGLISRQMIRIVTVASKSMPTDLCTMNISSFIGDKRMLIIVTPRPNMKMIVMAINQCSKRLTNPQCDALFPKLMS